jgi:opacity protein-like surface antigen
MKPNRLAALALAVLAGLAWRSDAQAQPRSPNHGPYFRVNLGPAFTQDGEITEFTGFPSGNKIEYNTGISLGLAGGFAFNKFVAAELELGSIWNEIDRVEGFSVDDTSLANVPFLANVVLQFPIAQNRVVPYIGGGFGGAATVFDADRFRNPTTRETLVGSDSDVVFAYQGFAGLRFNLNDQMFLGVDYKFFATEDSRYSYDPFIPGTGGTIRLGIEGVRSHVVAFSFTVKF